MSLVYFIPDDPSFDYIGFDVTTKEGYVFERTPADSPIESGAKVTDHLVKVPKTFSTSAVISNNPTRNTFYEAGAYVTTAAGVTSYQIARQANRAKEMLARLIGLQEAGVTGTLIGSLFEYQSMFLHRVSIDRGRYEIGHAEFQQEFREIQIVNTQAVVAPKPKEPRAAPKQNKGAQTGVEAQLKDLFGGDASLITKGWDYVAGRL